MNNHVVQIIDENIKWYESQYDPNDEYAYIESIIIPDTRAVRIVVSKKRLEKFHIDYTQMLYKTYNVVGELSIKTSQVLINKITLIALVNNTEPLVHQFIGKVIGFNNNYDNYYIQKDSNIYYLPKNICPIDYRNSCEVKITNPVITKNRIDGFKEIVIIKEPYSETKTFELRLSDIDLTYETPSFLLNGCHVIIDQQYQPFIDGIKLGRGGIVDWIRRFKNLNLPEPFIKLTGTISIKKYSDIFLNVKEVYEINNVTVEPVNFELRKLKNTGQFIDYKLPANKKEFWKFYAKKWHSLDSILIEQKASGVSDVTERDVIKYLGILNNIIVGDKYVYDKDTYMFVVNRGEKKPLIYVERLKSGTSTFLFLNNLENVETYWEMYISKNKSTTVFKFPDTFRLIKRIIHNDELQWENEIKHYFNAYTNENLEYKFKMREMLWDKANSHGIVESIHQDQPVLHILENIFYSSKDTKLTNTVLWSGRNHKELIDLGLSHHNTEVRRYAILCELSTDTIRWDKIKPIAFQDKSKQLMEFIYNEIFDLNPPFMMEYMNHSYWKIREHYINSQLPHLNYNNQVIIDLFDKCNINSRLRISLINSFDYNSATTIQIDQFIQLIEKWYNETNSEVIKQFILTQLSILVSDNIEVPNAFEGIVNKITFANKVTIIDTDINGLVTKILTDKSNTFIEILEKDENDEYLSTKCIGCLSPIKAANVYVKCVICNNTICSSCTKFFISSKCVCPGTLMTGQSHHIVPEES